jgi:hypothetical protein
MEMVATVAQLQQDPPIRDHAAMAEHQLIIKSFQETHLAPQQEKTPTTKQGDDSTSSKILMETTSSDPCKKATPITVHHAPHFLSPSIDFSPSLASREGHL